MSSTENAMHDNEEKEQTYLRSTFFEQMLEHVFVSEILQEAWFRHGETVEVLRSEIDAYGYDVVLECKGVVRHVQLKASKREAKTAEQKVHEALAKKPGGCVVWLFWEENEETRRVKLSYRFYGGRPHQRIDLSGLITAKHTKANAQGEKKERPAIRVVPKGRFAEVSGIGELVDKLFGFADKVVQASADSARSNDLAALQRPLGIGAMR